MSSPPPSEPTEPLAPDAESAQTDASSAAALWRIRPYRRFWWTRLTSQLASQMMMVALGWQMYDLTGSAWDLGLVGLAQFLPALLLTLPAGHVADHHHRARIVRWTTLAQAAVAAVLVAGSHGGWVARELILALSVGLGVAKAFQMPASQALPALLVPPALLARAVALNSSGMQLAVISGPALGGLLYGAGGAGGSGAAGGDGAAIVYAVSAALFAVGSALAWGITHAPPRPSAEARSWASVWAGVHYLRGQPVLLGAISLDLFAVLLGGATALLPIFAKDILHAGPWALGLLRASPAAGALLISVWLAHRRPARHAGRELFGAVAVFGLCMVVFALSTSVWLSMLALAVSGAADMVSVVVRQTLVQLETPDAMRGRVSAVNAVFIGASNQLGEFESGATAALIGPVASVLLGGVGVWVVAGLWIRWFPDLWRRGALLAPRPPAG